MKTKIEHQETAQSEQSKGCNCKQWMVVSIVLMVLAVSGAYFLGMSNRPTNDGIIFAPSPQIISSPTTNVEPTPTAVSTTKSYTPSSNWQILTIPHLDLSLCLPPKWEVTDSPGYNSAQIYFTRDPAYRPPATYIQYLPYNGGSRREQYINAKVQYEPDAENLKAKTSVAEHTINGKSILEIAIPTFPEVLVMVLGDRLYSVGIDYNPMVNDSETAFRNDIFTIVGCMKRI